MEEELIEEAWPDYYTDTLEELDVESTIIIYGHPGLTAREVQTYTGLDAETTQATLDRLVAQGRVSVHTY